MSTSNNKREGAQSNEQALVEVQTIEQPLGLSPEDFELSIKWASAKAKALKEIVDSNGLTHEIGGKYYMGVEGWMTIGAGYQYTAFPEWTRQKENGIWECRAVVRNKDGVIVGSGESECGGPDDGFWDRQPNNSRKSMVQTRAISKAYRSCLSWVVVLAGFEPTPKEEMEHVNEANSGHGNGKPFSQPVTASVNATPVDDEFFCPEHQTEWFMRGPNMKGYAHPTERKNEKGKAIWCNRDAWIEAHPSTEPEEEPLSIFDYSNEVEPEEEEEDQGIGI